MRTGVADSGGRKAVAICFEDLERELLSLAVSTRDIQTACCLREWNGKDIRYQ